MQRALVITDSEWVRNDVRAGLTIGDWEILDLSNPRETLEALDETEPQVVIVDLQVGSMGGMAVIREIRGQIEASERPRLVLLLDRSADEFLARRAGADAFVVKPFTAPALRAAVGEFESSLPPPTGDPAPRKSAPSARP